MSRSVRRDLPSPDTVVGFVGLGAMGGPMADHVARAGLTVRVFDLDHARIEARLVHGATAASSPADAALSADVVCIVVHDDRQVLDVISDPLLDSMAPDGVIVLHSTVTVATARDAARRCAARRRHLIDVGISGGVAGCRNGSLLLIAGGDPDLVDRVEPVLNRYGREIVHCGPIGAGMAAKVARNLIALASMAVTAEALALGEAAGVRREVLAGIVRETEPLRHCHALLDGTMVSVSGSAPEEIAVTGLKDLAVAHAMGMDLRVDMDLTDAATRSWSRVPGSVRATGTGPDPIRRPTKEQSR